MAVLACIIALIVVAMILIRRKRSGVDAGRDKGNSDIESIHSMASDGSYFDNANLPSPNSNYGSVDAGSVMLHEYGKAPTLPDDNNDESILPKKAPPSAIYAGMNDLVSVFTKRCKRKNGNSHTFFPPI